MSESENDDKKYRCPCGGFWPCLCQKAEIVLGFHEGIPADAWDINANRFTVAEAKCPRCAQSVKIQLDPMDVTGESKAANAEFWSVDEAGFPPTGECCELLFVIQPMGELECFDLRETEEA